MSRRCIGYEGEGRARRPIWETEGPAVGRTHGMVAGAVARGYAVIGGSLVQGDSERDLQRAYQRAYRARQRAQG